MTAWLLKAYGHACVVSLVQVSAILLPSLLLVSPRPLYPPSCSFLNQALPPSLLSLPPPPQAHDHFLHVNASHILEVGPNQIPTGVLQPVEGTPFDLRDGSGSQLGNRIPLIDGGGKPGFDHCYVIEEYDPAASRRVTSTKGGKKEKGENVDKRKQAEAQGEMMEEEEEREEGKSIRNQARYMASLTEKESGRVMHVYGTQPGLQIYTANWLSEEKGEQHGAVCLETEFFPNAINDPTEGAAESVVLRPGQVYRHFTYHVFQTIPRERE